LIANGQLPVSEQWFHGPAGPASRGERHVRVALHPGWFRAQLFGDTQSVQMPVAPTYLARPVGSHLCAANCSEMDCLRQGELIDAVREHRRTVKELSRSAHVDDAHVAAALLPIALRGGGGAASMPPCTRRNRRGARLSQSDWSRSSAGGHAGERTEPRLLGRRIQGPRGVVKAIGRRIRAGKSDGLAPPSVPGPGAQSLRPQ